MLSSGSKCQIIQPLSLTDLQQLLKQDKPWPSSGVYVEFQPEWVVDEDIKYSYGIYDWILAQKFNIKQSISLLSFAVVKGQYTAGKEDVSGRHISILISKDTVEVKMETEYRFTSLTKDGMMTVYDNTCNQVSKWIRIKKAGEIEWRNVKTTVLNQYDKYEEDAYPENIRAFREQVYELIDYNKSALCSVAGAISRPDLSWFNEPRFKKVLDLFNYIARHNIPVMSELVPIWKAAIEYYRCKDYGKLKRDMLIHVLTTIEKCCDSYRSSHLLPSA